jgi:hypothetical protein
MASITLDTHDLNAVELAVMRAVEHCLDEGGEGGDTDSVLKRFKETASERERKDFAPWAAAEAVDAVAAEYTERVMRHKTTFGFYSARPGFAKLPPAA